MKSLRQFSQAASATMALAALTLGSGCYGHCHGMFGGYGSPPPPNPLGTTVDPYFQKQEENAEASDFVVYDHEFTDGTAKLNFSGEDHLRQIAARLDQTPFPVIVERSRSNVKESTKYRYPVNDAPKLDRERRELIVEALTAMGVQQADSRVVVAPALTPGFTDMEAERAYWRGIIGRGGFGGGGFGGGGGGGGSFGGGGGFGF